MENRNDKGKKKKYKLKHVLEYGRNPISLMAAQFCLFVRETKQFL